MKRHISELKKIYLDGNLVPFIGAGLSQPFGVPDWKNLIKEIASKIAIENINKKSFLEVINILIDRGDYFTAIKNIKSIYMCSDFDIQQMVVDIVLECISNNVKMDSIDNNYADLSKYNFNIFLTTNYENILSNFVKSNQIPCNLNDEGISIQTIINNKNNTRVFHLHGDINRPKTMILTEGQYSQLYGEKRFIELFQMFAKAKTFLFMGFSFNDIFIKEIIRYEAFNFLSKHYILLNNPTEVQVQYLKDNFNLETISYNATNSTHTIEIRNVLKKICGDNKDEIELTSLNGFVQLFKKYNNKINLQSGVHHFEISNRIFPAISTDDGIKYFDSAIPSLMLYMIKNEKVNFILTGEGGAGKTVLLLETCNSFLEKNSFSLYVPLSELNSQNIVDGFEPIEEFLRRYLWENNTDLEKVFRKYVFESRKHIILFLDGFNETKEDLKHSILSEIRKLLLSEYVTIVVSSRFDFRKNQGLFLGLRHLSVRPLIDKQINEYLNELNLVLPNNHKIRKMLTNPLMLNLFANVEDQFLKNGEIDGIEWKYNAHSLSGIMWNYLQCQIIKSVYVGGAILNYTIALRYIAAYIGWFMEKREDFIIERETIFGLVKEAINYYKNLWKVKRPQNLQDIILWYDCKEIVWDEKIFYQILLKDTHMIINFVGEKVGFIHQQFRDFYASLFYLDEIDYMDENVRGLSLESTSISSYVTVILSEMIEKTKLDRIWELLRYQEAKKYSFLMYNIMQIYKKLLNNNLACISFQHQDLRNLSLQDVFLERNDFSGALISSFTFIPEGHTGLINCVTFLDKNKKCMTGSDDKTARIWDIKTGQCLYSFDFEGAVICFAISSDEKRCAFGLDNGKIELWDIVNYTFIKRLKGHKKRVRSIDFSKDSGLMVSGGEDHKIIIWDLKNSIKIFNKLCHDRGVMGVKFTSDGKYFVSCSDDTTIKIWKLSTYELRYVLTDHTDFVRSIAITPDGKKCISASYDNNIKIWEISSGKLLLSIHAHNNKIRCIASSPDGKSCISGAYDNTVKIWSTDTGECIETIKERYLVRCLAYSSDGCSIISGSFDNTARIWDVEIGECTKALIGYSNWFRTITCSKDGKYCISGSYDNKINILDLETGEYKEPLEGHKNWVRSVVCSLDGNICISGSYDNSIKVWDINTRKCLHTLKGHEEFICSVACSPDGAICVSGSYDKSVRIWDIEKEKCIRIMNGHSEKVRCVAISPDGKKCISASYDKTLKIWEISSGKCLKTLYGHESYVRCVAYLPDGKRCVSGSYDNSIILWDCSTGEIIEKLEGHSNWVRTIAVSRDGKRCISGSDDQTIREWDLDTGTCTCVLRGHKKLVSSVVYVGDRKCLSGSDDNTLRLWNIEKQEVEKIFEGVPLIKIADCKFYNTIFESNKLKTIIKLNGGIVD